MPRFNLYSGPDQKDNADEALALIMDGFGFEQDYVLPYVRLAAGYIGVAIAAGVFWIEREHTFEEAYNLIAAACGLYFVLQGFYYLWFRFVEHNANYIGTKNATKVYISTANQRNTEEYKLSVWTEGKKTEVKGKFSEFVDYNGNVIRPEFQKLVEKALPEPLVAKIK